MWGTVCDDRWGLNDAQVVCRQLGYVGDSMYTTSAFYGQGSGPILLTNVACRGTEASLITCSSYGWGVQNCDHSEDAGVLCNSKQRLCNLKFSE